MSAVDLLAPPDASAVAEAVDAYAWALRKKYGDSLRGLYVFGSRARGDFSPYSDVDVAVVLDDATGQTSQVRPLSEQAYDVFLETGAEIQPWPFREKDWNAPEGSEAARLIRSAKRDGRAVAVA